MITAFSARPACAAFAAGALLLLGLEIQRRRVDAVALARRLGAVGKDVAEMSGTAGAMHLGARHEEAAVGLGLDGFLAGRLIEARPAGAGIELRRRIEHRLAAADAGIRPRLMMVPELAGEGALGAVLASHLVLLGRQLLAPLRIALFDLVLRLCIHLAHHPMTLAHMVIPRRYAITHSRERPVNRARRSCA